MQTPEITYRIAAEEDIPELRALFLEYAASIGVDLCFQNFNDELATLPGKYALPDGTLLLVTADGLSIGCVALRKVNYKVCEMKRLYVRPSFRGSGLGKELVLRIINEARTRGYASMRLDTLPTMTEAIALYRSIGFHDTTPNADHAIPGTIFMEKDL